MVPALRKLLNEKERQEMMDAGNGILHREGHPLKKGVMGLESKTASS